MHLRPDHAVHDLPTLHAFIRAHPLGIVTTSLPSESFPTLQCTHIPWVLDSDSSVETHSNRPNGSQSNENTSFLGVLHGHMARANPHSKAMVEAVTNAPEQPHLPGEMLIVFTSPVDHYITPSFYTESKSTRKAAVQVYGRATLYHDPTDDATGEFLHRQLYDLARLGEEGVMGYQRDSANHHAWNLDEAPPEYIATLKKNIVGMRVEITRIEGRFKVSQEKGDRDRRGVVDGLEGLQTERAREMAALVKSGVVS
ncbi:hypothetical protein N7492_002926 [Penicillium capsulatum]|uniref:FMN-binding split barrel n=1 Tax=Penicillium capsulatum TaxID=69766 RepID=A0A9W9IQ28_9EURO|nr:hypothetical protein N7492_002926 [Penicillium capsulatum]KAJ6122480.1 hypothetical protein N7512_004945 [Penicillium capsulatum]